MTDPYANRDSYRSLVSGDGMSYFRVTIKETDLLVGISVVVDDGDAGTTGADLSERVAELREVASQAALRARSVIECEIALRPEFRTSLVPLEPLGSEPELIRSMLRAAHVAGTGPMAAVAGAVSAYVGCALAERASDVIVENGGDIFMAGTHQRTVAISAGESAFSGKIGLVVDPAGGMGVCTSSGTYGHSLSFGKSDAAVVVADDCALADAVATMLGNKCCAADDLESAVEWAAALPGVSGSLAIMGDRLAAAGDIRLMRL